MVTMESRKFGAHPSPTGNLRLGQNVMHEQRGALTLPSYGRMMDSKILGDFPCALTIG